MSNQEQPVERVFQREELVDHFLRGVSPRELAGEFQLSEDRVYDELSAEFREREREILLEEQFAVQQMHGRLQQIERAAWEEVGAVEVPSAQASREGNPRRERGSP